MPIVDPPERVAGYFKLNRTHDAHMFYMFYESRSKGANDPVILWMTGEGAAEGGVCVCVRRTRQQAHSKQTARVL